MTKIDLGKPVAMSLVVALSLNTMVLGHAQASMISTTDVIRGETATPHDRARVNVFMARDDVRRELERLGVNPDEAAARVRALSDAEIARIAQHIDELPAGQSVVGPIIGAAVLIFIILLVTDLLCLTTVFKFTRCAAR